MKKEVRVQLKQITNMNLQGFIGAFGTLMPNRNHGWDFQMDDGRTISTTTVVPNTTLGNLEHPSCKEFSFQTKSGSLYVFRICGREHLFDYCVRTTI